MCLTFVYTVHLNEIISLEIISYAVIESELGSLSIFHAGKVTCFLERNFGPELAAKFTFKKSTSGKREGLSYLQQS